MSGSFSHSPAQVIQAYLIDQALVTDPADEGSWPIYCNFSPPTPDSTVTVYDTEGSKSGRVMIDGEVQEHAGIQIAIRCVNQTAGHNKCQSILIDFDQNVFRTLVPMGSNTYRIQSISRLGGVISAGREPGTGRRLFTGNALISLRLLPGTGSY